MKLPMDPANLDILIQLLDQVDAAKGWTDREAQEDLGRTGAFLRGLGMLPPITCLVGSTRYASTFTEVNLKLTLAGKIVLSIGAVTSDAELGLVDYDLKHKLDVLHMWKILLADEVYCINVDGYIGASTARELGFARLVGKPIIFHEPLEQGQAHRVNYDVLPEVADAMVYNRLAYPPSEDRVTLVQELWEGLDPLVYCFLDGCGEQAKFVGGRPLPDEGRGEETGRGTGHTWLSDMRGGVTRWFCCTKHQMKFDKARHRGLENGYDSAGRGRVGRRPLKEG